MQKGEQKANLSPSPAKNTNQTSRTPRDVYDSEKGD
jgi:hypothetical protein